MIHFSLLVSLLLWLAFVPSSACCSLLVGWRVSFFFLVVRQKADKTLSSSLMSEFAEKVTTSSKGQTPEEIAAEVAKRRAALQALIDAKKAPVKAKKEKKLEVGHKFWNTQVCFVCLQAH